MCAWPWKFSWVLPWKHVYLLISGELNWIQQEVWYSGETQTTALQADLWRVIMWIERKQTYCAAPSRRRLSLFSSNRTSTGRSTTWRHQRAEHWSPTPSAWRYGRPAPPGGLLLGLITRLPRTVHLEQLWSDIDSKMGVFGCFSHFVQFLPSKKNPERLISIFCTCEHSERPLHLLSLLMFSLWDLLSQVSLSPAQNILPFLMTSSDLTWSSEIVQNKMCHDTTAIMQ